MLCIFAFKSLLRILQVSNLKNPQRLKVDKVIFTDTYSVCEIESPLNIKSALKHDKDKLYDKFPQKCYIIYILTVKHNER